MAQMAEPPKGFRIATSTHEVFEAGKQAGRDRQSRRTCLRLYVRGQWMPGGLDSAISSVPRRARARNVPVTWGEPPFGEAREMPFDRIAVADHEPCLCATGFTCMARTHDDQIR